MVKKNTKLEHLIKVAEITSAYRVINHHQSFASLDCTTKLDSVLYPDSEIAAKQSNARTKATALIKNVLAPHAVKAFTDVIKERIPFYGISTYSSNHNAQKLFPLIIHYFTETEGLEIKLLNIQSLPNETSETITNYCIKSLQRVNMPVKKLSAFVADNTNTNFGGRQRQGVNNVFCKLKHALDREIEGIGCSAHILHNTISCATDLLSIDIEAVVLKIYKYFCIFTVRTERLKEFCENAQVNYNTILSHSRSRWLSLLPAVERILQMWMPLKEFFEVEKGTPKLISEFFKNPFAEAYFSFIHSQAFFFEKQIKKIEKRNISVIEVQLILSETKCDLKEGLENNFMGIRTQILLNDLSNNNLDDDNILNFKNDIKNYYKTAIKYLDGWVVPLKKF